MNSSRESHDESEQKLIRASGKGDAEAFAELYERHKGAVYAVCLAILKDSALAEDALQGTFFKAFLSLPKFQAGKPLRPWLSSIARRHCIDLKRRQRKELSLDAAIEDGVPLETIDPFWDETLEKVVGARNMAKLHRALATLPSRQRRALLLSALDGWSYESIASAEGSSVPAINMLLVRARRKLRQAWEAIGDAFGAAVISWRGIRVRIQTAAVRFRRRSLNAPSDGWLTTGGQALVAAGLVLVMTTQLPSQAPVVSQDNQAGRAANQEIIRTVAMAEPAAPRSPKSRSALDGGGATSLVPDVGQLLPWGQEATPEDTNIRSIEPSPDYQEDRTVFAASSDGCPQRCRLFVTNDGGMSWNQLPAQGLAAGSDLLIPPNYSKNGVFAMGAFGLQHSLDGGRTFTTVSPVTGIAQISPAFEAGDRRIIIASDASTLLFEYLADQRLTRPLELVLSAGNYNALGLSPHFPSDPTIVLGRAMLQPTLHVDRHADGSFKGAVVGSNENSFVNCKADGCADFAVNEQPMQISFSPAYGQDATVYALLGGNKLIRSVDMMQTFEYLDAPQAEDTFFSGLVASPGRDAPKIFLATNHYLNDAARDIYFSEDGGATWESSDIPLPDFAIWNAIDSLAVTSTGLLFASAWIGRGIACSQDGGRSWKARCSPEL